MSMMPAGRTKTSFSSIYLYPLGATKESVSTTGLSSRGTETSPISRGEEELRIKKARMGRKILNFLQENHAVAWHLNTMILTMVKAEP